MSDAEQVWSTAENGSVTITLKVKGGHEIPWIVLRYASVSSALAAFKKDEGAELMELFQQVSGAQKAFDQTYNNREAPSSRTQGKPEGADRPSPQVTLDADPFTDDAPPCGDTAEPDPTCKHGKRELKPYQGKNYWVCGGGLPKGDPDRCDPVIR